MLCEIIPENRGHGRGIPKIRETGGLRHGPAIGIRRLTSNDRQI